MQIQAAIRLCLEEAYASRSNATLLAYRNGLDKFLDMLSDRGIPAEAGIEVIKVDHVIQFPSWLMAKKYSKSTTGVYIAAIKLFLEWLVIQGYLLPDYVEGVRLGKSFKRAGRMRESKLPRFPEREDVLRMQKTVRELPYVSPVRERNIAIIEYLASTGCRNAEAIGLKIKDFDKELQTAIVTGKGNKQRRVFLSTEAAKALQAYWKVRGNFDPESPAFGRHDKGAGKKTKPLTTTTIRNIVKEVANAAGIEKFSPHYFRHAFAIRVLGQTGNLALAQDLLGHSSPASTRVYAKIYPEEMQAAHKEIFG